MKKFIIITLVVTLMLSIFVIGASAKMFTPPQEANLCLAFKDTNIAYPLYTNIVVANGQECVYPTMFAVYDTNEVELLTRFNGTQEDMLFKAKRTPITNIIDFVIVSGENGVEQELYSGAGYDVLLYMIDTTMYYAIVDTSYNFITSAVLGDSSTYVATNWTLTVSYAQELGYTIGYGVNPPPIESGHITEVMFDGLIPFVGGLGVTFVNGFTSMFITDGHINALGIFILAFFGIALAYGVIRWITGLFRKET